MRVAYLISQYPAINHTYILGEIENLRKHGLEVETISISPADRPKQQLDEAERAEQQRTFYIKGCPIPVMLGANLRAILRSPVRYFQILAFAFRMSGFCPAEIPRWVRFFFQAVVAGDRVMKGGSGRLHVHYASSVGLLVARLFPIRVSHTIHGSGEFENPAAFRLREKVRYAHFVCAISHFGKSQLMRFSEPREWGKVEVCPLGVDLARFPDDPRSGKGEDGGIVELITVGQLASAKGQHLMVDAVSLLRQRGRNVRLRLVGDGIMRQPLEERARQLGVERDIVFEGYRNHSEVARLVSRAAVFVMASFAEGVPVAMMEAMALGLPCISSGIMGIPELIEDGVSGLLVRPADPAGIASAVERLLDDAGLRRRLGTAARQKIAAEYNIETNTRLLAEIFARRARD